MSNPVKNHFKVVIFYTFQIDNLIVAVVVVSSSSSSRMRMRGYSPSSRMGLGRGASAAVYLGEVLVASTVAGAKPGVSRNHPINPSQAQKLVRPGGIHSSGRLKNSILAVKNDGFVASLVPGITLVGDCLLYTSPSPRDRTRSRMPSSA